MAHKDKLPKRGQRVATHKANKAKKKAKKRK